MTRNKNLPFTNGDICFLPEQISQKSVNRSAQLFLTKNKDLVLKELNLKELPLVFVFLHEIQRRYEQKYLNLGFFKKLPRKVQNYIATNDCIKNKEPYAILPQMPYTKFGYIILDEGIINDTIRFFELSRLNGIRQLGFLMDPIHREVDLTETALTFRHTRGLHSLDVAVFLRLIELNNSKAKLDGNLLSIGGVSHDALTPAGGDTTKLVNLKMFDEETNYKELFKKLGWEYLAKRYKVKQEDLAAMVLGKGLYGKILDIADKISYVSRDVWNFVGLKNFGNTEILYASKNFEKIRKLVNQYPNFCDVYKSVKVIGNDVVIEDGFLWGIFLKIRAMMFAGLYYNPASRFLEYMFSKRIISFLLKNKNITKEQLLIWKDSDLEEKIYEFLGDGFFPTCFKKSEYKKFATKKALSEEINSLRNNYSMVAIPDDFKSTTKTGVDKYLVKKDGKIMIFKEAYPEMASEIQNIMKFSPIFGLYLINLKDLNVPYEKHKKIKEALEDL
ncbi:MAG: hypothetical protein WA101_01180 [Minisyncoccia bacterium]